MYKTFTGGGAGAGVGAGVGVESVSAGVVATICCVVFASFYFLWLHSWRLQFAISTTLVVIEWFCQFALLVAGCTVQHDV